MRICLCIADEDLRTWVMEELLLMTWAVEPPTLSIASDPAAVEPGCALLIADAITAAPTVPAVVIGPDPGFPGVHVLTARLTSRELKHAIRAALPRASQTAHA